MNKKILIFLTISILISIIILKDLNQIKSKNDFKVDIKAVEKIEIGYLNLNKKVFTTWTKEKNYNEIRNIVDIYNNAKICREDCDTTPCYSMSIYSKIKKYIYLLRPRDLIM